MRLTKPVAQQRGAHIADSRTRAAPVGGWNARDPLPEMAPEDAVELVNFFPRERDVISRKGSLTHCDTDSPSEIRRLIEFERSTSSHLVAAVGGTLYDVTTGTPSTLGSSYSSNYWTSAKISGYLLLANGADEMQKYDGTTLTAAAFTGVDTDELSFIHVHHGRPFAIQKNTQKMWYGGIGAIGGALNEFDFETTGSFGGKLFALLTITRDGGNGPDDYLVALFSSGDCVVYSGTNPGDVDNWSRVGSFKMGRPLSRFAFADMGNDVVCVTERGYESVTVSIPFGDAAPKSRMISDRISPAVQAAITSVGASDNWSIEVHGLEQMLIVNVPTGLNYTQHVMNINTKRWCRFDGLRATAWGRMGSDLYLGTRSGIVKKYTGSNDDGAAIVCDLSTAWDYFGDPARIKHHKLQSLIFETRYMPTINVYMGCDFGDIPLKGTLNFSNVPPPPEWNVDHWGACFWSKLRTTRIGYTKCGPVGRASSTRVQARITQAQLAFSGITYIYEKGGFL